ncbi:hypothetical protein ABIA45_007357 [Bradyrhizobium sp. USDA 336]
MRPLSRRLYRPSSYNLIFQRYFVGGLAAGADKE